MSEKNLATVHAMVVLEAAVYSGLSKSSIWEKIQSGELPSVKVAGRRLILREDLEAFLEAGRQPPPPPRQEGDREGA